MCPHFINIYIYCGYAPVWDTSISGDYYPVIHPNIDNYCPFKIFAVVHVCELNIYHHLPTGILHRYVCVCICICIFCYWHRGSFDAANAMNCTGIGGSASVILSDYITACWDFHSQTLGVELMADTYAYIHIYRWLTVVNPWYGIVACASRMYLFMCMYICIDIPFYPHWCYMCIHYIHGYIYIYRYIKPFKPSGSSSGGICCTSSAAAPTVTSPPCAWRMDRTAGRGSAQGRGLEEVVPKKEQRGWWKL